MNTFSAIKISPGDYFIFNRKSLSGFLSTIDTEFLDEYNLSIEKMVEGKWKVGFPDKDGNYICLKLWYTSE